MRRYSWKTLVLGAVISVFLFSLPFFSQIFSKTFVSSLQELVQSIFPQVLLQSPILEAFVSFLILLPFMIAIVIFAVEARTGFTLRGPGIEALYLPCKFREAIAFVRSVQDGGSILKELETYPREEREEPTNT